MRLTTFSDHALRVLAYAAAADGRVVTIEETSNAYGISRAHLMKVVHMLTRAGYVRSLRGRSGGFLLARPAAEIRLGDVMLATEPNFELVECFGGQNRCAITQCCRFSGVMREALTAFLARLNRHTIADIVPGAPDAAPPRSRERGSGAAPPAG
jgi:Rrf2 family nitric oxide-sensitive transcriptional repressor